MNVTMRSIVYVFAGVVLAKLLSVCSSLFIARTLLPEEYGIWVAIMLVASYAGIAHLGTVEALLKQYPYLFGAGEYAKAAATERSVFGFVTLAAGLLILAAILAPVSAPDAYRNANLTLISLMLATAGLSLLSLFFYHRFAAHQEFKMVSITDTSRAFYTAILLMILSWFWGLPGAVWGFFLAEVLVCTQSIVLGSLVCGRITPALDRQLLWQLIQVGFPITLVWWVTILQQTSDRLISMAMLGKTATGYYGLGVSIVFTLALIPQVVGQVLYPKINAGVGQGMTSTEMEKLVVLPTRAFSLILPVVIGLLIILAPAIYNQLFPKYSPGLLPAQILLGGGFFVCLFRNGANFLIARHQQYLLLRQVTCCLLFNLVLTYLLVKFGLNIAGIALSSSLSSALLTSLVWKKVFAELGYGLAGQLRQLFHLYLPFLLLLGLIGGCRAAVTDFNLLPGMYHLYFTASFIVFMIAMLLGTPPLSRWSRDLCQLLRISIASKH